MPEIIICPSCGKETYVGVARCPHCGDVVDEEAARREEERAARLEQHRIYGGFWRRVGGAFIDGILIDVPLFALDWISGGLLLVPIETKTETGTDYVVGLTSQGYVIVILIWWLYEAVMTSSKLQGTVGKLAVGLLVTDEEGVRLTFAHATGRHFAKYLSAILLGIGFLMVAIYEKKRGLHDRLANTLVLKRAN